MNKKLKIFLGFLWLLFVIIPLVVMVSQVKYPALDMKRFGWLIPMFLALPIIYLFLCFLTTKDKHALNKASDLLLYTGAGIYLVLIFAVTFGFRVWSPAVYPVCSQTKNSADYLLIEDKLEYSEERYINAVFPSEIPSNASDVKYYYKCNTGLGNYTIRAEWTLPSEDYILVKKKEFLNEENMVLEDGNEIYTIDMNNDKYFAEITFNDSDYRVAYYLKSIG